MRLRHPDGSVVHLSYGSNVHPAESVDGIVEQLRHYGGGVRAALDADLLGVGLWLPATAAHELAVDPAAVERVRRVLHLHRLEIVTVNAFPFEGFHDPVVKRAVYRPDWSVRARLDYTLDCARVLAMLLPDDAARGSISTLPLGWRSPWYADRDATAHEHLDQLVDGLALDRARGRPDGPGRPRARARLRDRLRRRRGRPSRGPGLDRLGLPRSLPGHLSPGHGVRRGSRSDRPAARGGSDRGEGAGLGRAARRPAQRSRDADGPVRLRRGPVPPPGPRGPWCPHPAPRRPGHGSRGRPTTAGTAALAGALPRAAARRPTTAAHQHSRPPPRQPRWPRRRERAGHRPRRGGDLHLGRPPTRPASARRRRPDHRHRRRGRAGCATASSTWGWRPHDQHAAQPTPAGRRRRRDDPGAARPHAPRAPRRRRRLRGRARHASCRR